MVADHDGLITAEACPHHLLFSIDDYSRLGSLIKMNPSVKSRSDVDALWQGLRSGKIQVIATDHAPHTLEEKQQPFPHCPSGLPAVENSLSLLLSEVNRGRISLEHIVQWMCEAPARVWNMVQKGRIERGYDADLVLVDLEQSRTIRNRHQQTKCGWSPWDGYRVTGIPVRTWVRGQTVYRWSPEQEWFGDSGHGREIEFELERVGYWGSRGAVRMAPPC